MAAVFGIIAYITTGVVSAVEAIAYLQTVLPRGWEMDDKSATIGLLFFFCLLTNLGIKESAVFAKIIFVIHVIVLSLLSIAGTIFMIINPELLYKNWDTPYPQIRVHSQVATSHEGIHFAEGGLLTALFYGFSSAMLGVSGFETSSQFVEEQAPGVFPKTLRNMWMGIMLFNPLLSLISFSALEMTDIMKHTDTVLARTAFVIGHWFQTNMSFPDHYRLGPAFSTLVSIDAFIVLAAALLTSFIGINGLIRRMSMDRCLPQFLLIQNPFTGTDSFILVGFFLLCVSQVVVFDTNVAALGGVYCYAFLAVMIIFAIGNMLLKVKRPSLPREVSVSWLHASMGLASVVIALMGNVLGKPELLTFFFVYVFIVGTMVFAMFQRVSIVRLLYKLIKPKRKKLALSASEDDGNQDDDESINTFSTYDTVGEEVSLMGKKKKRGCLAFLSEALKKFQNVPFVFFCKHDDVHLINKAILYIQRNEQTNKIIIVHCANGTDTVMLAEHVKLMDLLYPKTKISLLIVDSTFTPAVIEWTSQALKVPINAMFISCPDKNFAMKVNQLRGMRIITGYD
jgi:amino acid transporter